MYDDLIELKGYAKMTSHNISYHTDYIRVGDEVKCKSWGFSDLVTSFSLMRRKLFLDLTKVCSRRWYRLHLYNPTTELYEEHYLAQYFVGGELVEKTTQPFESYKVWVINSLIGQ